MLWTIATQDYEAGLAGRLFRAPPDFETATYSLFQAH
jgi:hypothetical protein